MTDADLNRRLAAILAADVAGYSRLVAAGEDAALSAMQAHRTEFVDPLISRYNGRIANTAGDSILAEFASVVDAVRFAIDMQKGMAQRNVNVDEAKRIVFRVGIHFGDVIERAGDLLGDNVNIAARLESLSKPGGLNLSAATFDQVQSRLDERFVDLGWQTLKNIPEPVHVYELETGRAEPAPSIKPAVAGWRPGKYAVAGLGVATLLSAGLWWALPVEVVRSLVGQKQMSNEPGPAGPSIAIMPFTDLSPDGSRDYLAAGITEDITTDLSRVAGLLVKARSATALVDDATGDLAKVGERLGVRHILEGSVQREGDRLRITARMVDVQNGAQVWAERYDRDANDLFAIRDEIAASVVANLSSSLTGIALSPVKRGYTPDIEAYDFYIRGRAKRIPPTPDNLAAAQDLFDRAIAKDPKFAGGYAGSAFTHILRYALSTVSPAESEQHLDTALGLARKAVELDPAFGPAHGSLAQAYLRKHRYDDALDAIRKAVEIAPNDSLMRALYGNFLGIVGRPEEGIEQVSMAMRMSPDSLPMLYFLGDNYRTAGKFDKAIEALTEHRQRLGGRVIANPAAQLAVAYVQAGQLEKAKTIVKELLGADPAFTIQDAVRTHPYKDKMVMDIFVDALAQAGLPEGDR